jgi:hypothetical protein
VTEKVPSRTRGKTYEATYLGWLDFFESLAKSPDRCLVKQAPVCWRPFIRYMGHVPGDPAIWFAEDSFFEEWPAGHDYETCRRIVEIASTCRPELAHALYLWDTEWRLNEHARVRTRHNDSGRSKEFVVTCNASLFRPEVLEYLERLRAWEPPDWWEKGDRAVVLCPPAADKPYPAPLHTAIRETLPKAYLIVATGVLGLVPCHLWIHAPNYTAGIPFNERVYQETLEFFLRRPYYGPLVVYSDFLAEPLTRALRGAAQPHVAVFEYLPQKWGYLPLHEPQYLKKLKEAASRASVSA